MSNIKNLEFGYWESFGISQSIRYLLHYKKSSHPCKEKTYHFNNLPEWGAYKPELRKETHFPNLPYLKFDDGDKKYSEFACFLDTKTQV